MTIIVNPLRFVIIGKVSNLLLFSINFVVITIIIIVLLLQLLILLLLQLL